MVCGNFILPEPANYVFFYAVFNLRNLLYLIPKVAETLENTGEIIVILKGAACQKEMPSKWMAFLFGIWALQRPLPVTIF